MDDDAYDGWHIFLAHAGPDANRAEELYDLLTGRCRVFLDSRCLLLGDDWDLAPAPKPRTARAAGWAA